jgi:hypothetical protein
MANWLSENILNIVIGGIFSGVAGVFGYFGGKREKQLRTDKTEIENADYLLKLVRREIEEQDKLYHKRFEDLKQYYETKITKLQKRIRELESHVCYLDPNYKLPGEENNEPNQ